MVGERWIFISSLQDAKGSRTNNASQLFYMEDVSIDKIAGLIGSPTGQ